MNRYSQSDLTSQTPVNETTNQAKVSYEVGTQQQTTREIGVQVDITIPDSLQDLKNCIHLLQVEVCDLKKWLDCAYDYVVESWNCDQTLCEKNNSMAHTQTTQFNSQAKRINAIIQIAQQKRQNVYNDIESLISNKQRFSLDNLLEYTSQSWLIKCNPVIVNFIETLTCNNSNDSDLQEKIFKRVVAVDAIYGSRHGKYVSEINLAASAIKYSLACSKTIIDIDNHIISSGGYTKFINWLESLAIEQPPLPAGFYYWHLIMSKEVKNTIWIVDIIQLYFILLPALSHFIIIVMIISKPPQIHGYILNLLHDNMKNCLI